MATPGQLQMFNKMEQSEMFGLDQRAMNPVTGKIERIQIHPDGKVPDAVVFHIWLEDHTLGNSIRMELLRNENVLFAGYKVPHPLNNMIELRVQTLPRCTPEEAVRLAVRNLKAECSSMLDQFDEGVAKLQAEAAAKELPPAGHAPLRDGGSARASPATAVVGAEERLAAGLGEMDDARLEADEEDGEESPSPEFSPEA
mmetsp:Transcript_10315/g.26692  ORF Transcript_10315/g.26692 Transcript_10315/m.26692 type:complete len:199 (-) Transcript_10315:221-817(-)|eukprot:CAMPEP_0183435020 /NCGR_PEP_ID=MMETSP0370-20130417/66013_1 /TAXON_ID=268820 /ORGANISM="Peridinium aciculiferum, Strain PAER-2" /LENGTH=198 /DNA_ID=CAMNT_0025621951 /DNA_START=104 /DNA_END=700 /DNA_ORIENTATION=+